MFCSRGWPEDTLVHLSLVTKPLKKRDTLSTSELRINVDMQLDSREINVLKDDTDATLLKHTVLWARKNLPYHHEQVRYLTVFLDVMVHIVDITNVTLSY